MSDEQPIAGFRQVPRTGVIYVTSEATKKGFSPSHADWCNLGQGQPETGPAARCAPARVPRRLEISRRRPGVRARRRAVRELQRGHRRRSITSSIQAGSASSKYTCGERLRLRWRPHVADARGRLSLGRGQPRPLPARLHGVRGAARHLQGVHRHPDPPRRRARVRVQRRRSAPRDRSAAASAALLLSNPCNPTGRLIDGDELSRSWVAAPVASSSARCSFDEFYSHYIYGSAASRAAR